MIAAPERKTERAIISSSSARMTRAVARMPPPAHHRLREPLNWLLMGMSGFCFSHMERMLSSAASRLSVRLTTGGRGQKLLPAVVAAKVERLSVAFAVESGCFVHGHSAEGVFGHGFRFFHGHVPSLVVVVTVF
jgi:hypothetical protein